MLLANCRRKIKNSQRPHHGSYRQVNYHGTQQIEEHVTAHCLRPSTVFFFLMTGMFASE